MKIKFKTAGYFVLLLSVALNIQAMETLSENELAQSIGQDGLTMGLNLGTNGNISLNHVFIEDRDGIRSQSNYNQPAGLAYILKDANTGIQFWAGASRLQNPFSLVVDADGRAGKPLMNIGFLFNPNLSQIKLQAFSLALAKNHPTIAGSLNSISRRDIIKTGASGVDILFKTGNPLGINLQLGSQAQSAMFVFSGGSIDRIKTDQPLEVLSYSGCNTTQACTSASSMKFGFDLKANNTTTGIRLDGISLNTTNNGLEIRKNTPLDGFDLALSNIAFGNAGSTNANSFQGLPNASIGTVGVENVKISGLQMNLKGF